MEQLGRFDRVRRIIESKAQRIHLRLGLNGLTVGFKQIKRNADFRTGQKMKNGRKINTKMLTAAFVTFAFADGRAVKTAV